MEDNQVEWETDLSWVTIENILSNLSYLNIILRLKSRFNNDFDFKNLSIGSAEMHSMAKEEEKDKAL